MSNGPFADFQNEVYLKGLLGEPPTIGGLPFNGGTIRLDAGQRFAPR